MSHYIRKNVSFIASTNKIQTDGRTERKKGEIRVHMPDSPYICDNYSFDLKSVIRIKIQ